MTQDELKLAVAQAAMAYIPANCIVGVGTGSTANFFIDELGKIKQKLVGAVASSEASAQRLRGHGIEVISLNDAGSLPVYVDGADEITQHLHMIKGGGGALTREKIVAAASKKFICVPFIHEVGCTIAAEYFNETSIGANKAFALVTAGPGLTNTITGIASAWVEGR